MSYSLTKQLVYFNEFKEIISIFGQTEVGTSEVDVKALADYLASDKFFVDMFDYNIEDIDGIDLYITNLIENGFPVWRFLKISNWTKNMLEQSFTEECEEELKEMQKTYCCLSCNYYMVKDTPYGLLIRCTNKDCKHYYGNRNGALELQKECKEYEKNII